MFLQRLYNAIHYGRLGLVSTFYSSDISQGGFGFKSQFLINSTVIAHVLLCMPLHAILYGKTIMKNKTINESAKM